LNEKISEFNGLLQNLVVYLDIKSQPFQIKIFDKNFEENLSLQYKNQDVQIELDLAFKEILNIKAMGLEVKSKKSLHALKFLGNEMISHMLEI
jgi:hypothetical protein